MNKKIGIIMLVVILSGCTTNNYTNNNFGSGTITASPVQPSHDVRVLNGIRANIGLKPSI